MVEGSTLIILRIHEVQFKNPIFDELWYQGEHQFSQLWFRECNINLLKTGAFNKRPFYELDCISIFSNTETILLENNLFTPLYKLRSLIIKDSKIGNLGPDLDWGIGRTINTFFFIGLPQSHTIQDMLGRERTVKLLYLQVNRDGTSFISDKNFTKLVKVSTLDLSKCGIETIQAHAFDFIGLTLENLFLSNNRLRSIDPQLFRSFIFVQRSYKKVELNGNLIPCDCNFVWLKNMLLINFGVHSKVETTLKCSGPDRPRPYQPPSIQELNCYDMQVIQIKKIPKMHQPGWTLTSFAYKRFHLNVINDSDIESLRIRTNVTEQFKVLIGRFETGRKIDYSYQIQGQVQCVLITNASQHLTLHYEQSGLYFVAIFYLTSLRVWPLHLVTLNRIRHSNNPSTSELFVMISCISIWCCLAFSIGLVAGVFVRFGKKKAKRSVPTPPPTTYTRFVVEIASLSSVFNDCPSSMLNSLERRFSATDSYASVSDFPHTVRYTAAPEILRAELYDYPRHVQHEVRYVHSDAKSNAYEYI